LNPQPADYKSAALPIELRQQIPCLIIFKHQALIILSAKKQKHTIVRIADSNFYDCVCQVDFYFFAKKLTSIINRLGES
jgi:hypothetical protein